MNLFPPRLCGAAALIVFFLLSVGCLTLATGPWSSSLSGAAATESESLVEQVFGCARHALSYRFFLEADRYFHRGVGHAQGHQGADGFVARWVEAISPTRHETVGSAELEEMMPWLRFATAADPGNVDAFVTTAYWLGRKGDYDRAELALLEGLRHNPDDHRLHLALGNCYWRAGWAAKARTAYQSGLETWPGAQDPAEREVALARVELLMSLGAVHEGQDDYAAAVECYRQLIHDSPEHQALSERIALLEAGEDPGPTYLWTPPSGQAQHGPGLPGPQSVGESPPHVCDAGCADH